MTRDSPIAWALALALFVAASATATSPAAVATTTLSAPTLEQIVARHVAARGGLNAWRAVQSLSMSGEMDAGGKAEDRLPFVMSLKRPHKIRLDLRFQDQAAVQVFDGRQGWKLRPYLGRTEAEPFTAAELKSAAAAPGLDGPLVDYANKGTRLSLEGRDEVEGKGAYRLRLVLKGGERLNLWIDASSFLELKIDGEPRRMDGHLRKVAILYRDFRKVGDLTMPHLMETVIEGVKGSHKMAIQSIKINPPLDDSLFTKPQPAPTQAGGQ